MIILNFSHLLTDEHLAQIEALSGEAVERVIEVPSQFESDAPYAGQIEALVAGIGLSPTEWQTLPLLVNSPSYNFAAVTLLAHLEGRMGYLPSVLRLRPVEGAAVRRFEVAEIISLAEVQEEARKRR
jgi:hypothetical protein